jgi:hypothetical protein
MCRYLNYETNECEHPNRDLLEVPVLADICQCAENEDYEHCNESDYVEPDCDDGDIEGTGEDEDYITPTKEEDDAT